MSNITIKDVAKAAGVSISTVSKVINDAPTISKATKERIRDLMKEMNYYPNVIARSFVHQSSKNIGVIMELKRNYAFIHSHVYEILGGIEGVLNENGYMVTLLNTTTFGNSIEPYEKLIREKRVDGMIIHIANINKSLCKKIDELGFPYIIIGQPDFESNISWIDVNNKAAGEIATKHLLDEGFSRIAFIGSTSKDNVSNSRQLGYRSTLIANNIKVCKEYLMEGEPSEDGSEEMMEQLLNLPVPPDSIICLNNYVAIGALKAIKRRGLRIPQDIAIISFDNYPLSMYTEPPLSVVDNDVFELGAHAAKALLNKIDNPNLQMQYSMLSPKLILRNSSK